MPNVNAESGKNYERRVIAAVNGAHPDLRAFKQHQPAWADLGDIRFSTVVLQAKAITAGTKTVSAYLDAAEEQASRHETDTPLIPAVIVRTAPEGADDIIVLRASTFFALIDERDLLEHALDEYHCPDPR